MIIHIVLIFGFFKFICYKMAQMITQYSSFEKFHKTTQAFSRNKNIYNVKKINKLENINIIKRRTPYQYLSDSSVSDRISTSFINSRTTQCEKISKQIHKFKERMTVSTEMYSNDGDQFAKKQINVLEMGKMVSREYIDNLRNKLCPDERLFNNYQESEYPEKKIIEFQKYLAREYYQRKLEKHTEKIDSQKLGKDYQDLIFKKSTLKCMFDLKKQELAAQKKDLRNSKKQPPLQIDSQLVCQGLKNIQKHTLYCQFYRYQGKQKPSSIDIRLMNPLLNHWIKSKRNSNSHKPYSHLDFGRKIKTQMIQRRIEDIKKKKNSIFKRSEVCHAKYFSLPKNKREI